MPLFLGFLYLDCFAIFEVLFCHRNYVVIRLLFSPTFLFSIVSFMLADVPFSLTKSTRYFSDYEAVLSHHKWIFFCIFQNICPRTTYIYFNLPVIVLSCLESNITSICFTPFHTSTCIHSFIFAMSLFVF